MEDLLTWWLPYMAGELHWLLVGGLSSSQHAPLHGAVSTSLQHGGQLPIEGAIWPGDEDRSCSTINDQALGVTHCHLCSILLSQGSGLIPCGSGLHNDRNTKKGDRVGLLLVGGLQSAYLISLPQLAVAPFIPVEVQTNRN